MKKDFITIIIFLLSFGIFSFVCGVMEIGSDRDLGLEQCVYKSYASQYNYAYRMGCELFKER